MGSERGRCSAPTDDSWSRLLQHVWEVVEQNRGGCSPARQDSGSGSTDADRLGQAPRRREGDGERGPPRRETYDQALFALLRLLAESRPLEGRDDGDGAPTDGARQSEQDAPEVGPDEARDSVADALGRTLALVARRRDLLPDLSPYDESWAMLIAATLAEREGKRISVSELCRRIGCALATGQRRVDRLERLELLDRAADPDDLRRHIVFPTERGRKAAQDYAESVVGLQPFAR